MKSVEKVSYHKNIPAEAETDVFAASSGPADVAAASRVFVAESAATRVGASEGLAAALGVGGLNGGHFYGADARSASSLTRAIVAGRRQLEKYKNITASISRIMSARIRSSRLRGLGSASG